MTPLLNKFTSAVASGVVVLFGLALAGLGLSVVFVLALFALAAAGLSLLAAPVLACTAATDHPAPSAKPTGQATT